MNIDENSVTVHGNACKAAYEIGYNTLLIMFRCIKPGFDKCCSSRAYAPVSLNPNVDTALVHTGILEMFTH